MTLYTARAANKHRLEVDLAVPHDQTATVRPLRDLRLRLASGAAMAALALLMTWAGTASFAVLVGAVALVVSWEWGRIVRGGTGDAALAIHGAAVAAAVLLTAVGRPLSAVGAIAVGAGLVAAVVGGPPRLMSALGVAYAGLPALVLVWLRASEPLGLLAVVYLLLVVWSTDTGAYAAGRLIGGPRLMPQISPNKTWSGLLGGMAAAGLVGLVLAIAGTGLSAAVLMPTAVGLAFVAQVGDLMESALKRRHAVKDASSLIPGHGGFMDRVDGLILAAMAVGLLALLLSPASPATALLTWR